MNVPIGYVVGIVVVLAGTVAFLFRALQRCQEARLRLAQEHERTLEHIKTLIAERKKRRKP